MYVRTYVRTYVWMDVWMYVCMYVYTHVCIYTHVSGLKTIFFNPFVQCDVNLVGHMSDKKFLK